MKLQMFKPIYGLMVLLVVVPAIAKAQMQHAPALCPSASFTETELIEPTQLAKLSTLELPELTNLAALQELQEMEVCVEIPSELMHSYDAEKRRVLDRNYKVSRAHVLDIENKFGKVHINTWNKDEIKVKIEIVARASSEDKAKEILDNISIEERKEAKLISLKTKMEPMRISGSRHKSFEINYTIYMPEDNSLVVKNSFGDVYLASLKGKADITVKYGALKSEKLSNNANEVKLAYGSGSCGYINGGSIEVAYSDMNVERTNGLQGSSKFSDFKIGNLGEALELELKYGSFKVESISKDIRKISLESGFSPILLNFEDNLGFNFDVNVQFADFKVDKSLVNLTSVEKNYTSAEYKGKFGNSSGKALVSISSKYGDVKFTK